MAGKRRQIERAEQGILVRWFRYAYPKHHLVVSANGGSRHLLEAVNLKRSGVSAGWPDIFLPVPNQTYSGLWIEFKPEHKAGTRKGVVSDLQEDRLNYLNEQGYKATACWGFDEASSVIIHYMKME